MEDKTGVPTISRTLDDGTLIELVYDPAARTTALAVGRPDADAVVLPAYDLPSGERLIPYTASNNLIATECVLLPSEVGETLSKAELLGQVRSFIHTYVDLSPTFAEIAAHYVLLSWVYDAFSEVPYLRLQGDYGTGKTRALLAIGSLCYKPFFASGASTVSPIFHILETFGGTLIIDEADFRFSDATAELTKILNNGNVRGLPLLRTMTNRHRELNPQAFRVYGPKLIGMRHSFSDRALESRLITEQTGGRSLRPDIPIHIPDAFRDEARVLRNKLLAWRFRTLSAVTSDETRLVDRLSPRAKQTVLSLLSIMDDPKLREAVCSRVGEVDDLLRIEGSRSVERALIEAVVVAFDRGGSAGAAVGMITNFFNENAPALLGHVVTSKRVGSLLRSKFGLPTVKSHSVYAIPTTHRTRALDIAKRYGIDTGNEEGVEPDAQSAVSLKEDIP